MFKVVFHFLTSGFGYIHAKSGVARSPTGNVVRKMIPHSNLEDYHPVILSRMFLDNPSIVLRLDEARKKRLYKGGTLTVAVAPKNYIAVIF